MEQLLDSFYKISAYKSIKKKWEISEEKYNKLYFHQVKGLVFMLNQHMKVSIRRLFSRHNSFSRLAAMKLTELFAWIPSHPTL